MSFSTEIKEEITRQEYDVADKKSILSALIKISGTLNMTKNGLILDIRTENAKIAKLLFVFIRDVYSQDSRLMVYKKAKLKKNNVYIVQIRNNVIKIMEDLDVYDNGKIDLNPGKEILLDDEKVRSYLAGCFLSSGSINDPLSKDYHLEISTHSENHSIFVNKILNKYNLYSKVIKRRNKFVIYIKKSESISDFLRIIRAQNGVLNFEQERISKDYWNSNNRLNICEVSNEVRTLENANKQVEQIKYIKDLNKDYLLSSKEKEVADIRIENPEISLNEIAQIYSEKYGKEISKSGINHRFRKINTIYEKLKKEEDFK